MLNIWSQHTPPSLSLSHSKPNNSVIQHLDVHKSILVNTGQAQDDDYKTTNKKLRKYKEQC